MPCKTEIPDHQLILLSAHDLERLLKPQPVVEALRKAYRELALNRENRGQSLAFAIDGGSAHVKAGLLRSSNTLAAKVNVNLPDNWMARRLPTIQGVLLLADTATGRPLAVMDSIALTGIRTAAAAMLAAGYGANQSAKVAAIIGCGAQARYQADALLSAFSIEQLRVFDIDEARARTFAASIESDSGRVIIAKNIPAAIDTADICITCTTSTKPFLTDEMRLTGCFVAAMGADNPQKSEIAPALMARARILVDDTDQCALGGDLAHALKAGAVSRHDVHADLADLASGQKSARHSPDDLVIFDSCGSGVQDVAAAWAAYQAACTSGAGTRFDMTG